MSCLGRERIFEHFSRTLAIPMALIRLNYATEMRYGVLVDIAGRVRDGLPIDLSIGSFNVIWQGDANAMTLQAFDHVATPPWIGQRDRPGGPAASARSPRRSAGSWAGRWRSRGRRPPLALLSDAGQAFRLFGPPRVDADRMIPLDRRLGRARRPDARRADPLRGERRPVLKDADSSARRSRRPCPPSPTAVRTALDRGVAIPAMPLALTPARRLDERRQRALDPLLRRGRRRAAWPSASTRRSSRSATRGTACSSPCSPWRPRSWTAPIARGPSRLIRIAGVCGATRQAVAEAELARDLGYHAGLLSLAALADADEDALIAHCRAVAEVIPLVGFYLQPSVGGRVLPYRFWRQFAEIEGVVAIKIAPFNRYQTLDVVRAVAEAGRDDIALYTGNDDNIVLDLLTPYRIETPRGPVERRIVGGLLGHWSVWTSRAVELLDGVPGRGVLRRRSRPELLRTAVRVTDANAAFFDAANDFAGCIAGLHEVLRRQGLLEGTWCLDPDEALSPGQAEEIDRVYRSYPDLNDDAFVAAHRDAWLSG